MKLPYTLLLPPIVKKQQDVKGRIPEGSSYIITYPDTLQHFVFKKDIGEMLRQELNHFPFYIDFIQSKLSRELTFDFEIHSEQFFLCFIITGGLELGKPSVGRLSQIKEMYYYASFSKPSVYNVTCLEGVNTIVVINISHEWLERYCSHCLNLKNMLNECLTGKEKYGLLPQCKIEKEVQKCLIEIQIASNENLGVLDGLLRMRVAKLLGYYDSQVTVKFNQLPYRVKEYLNSNFTDPACDNSSIASIFHVTERTLRNNFKVEFDITIQDYLTSLRMEKAWELSKEGKSAKDIYACIGYNDERTFRYKFKKYLECKL